MMAKLYALNSDGSIKWSYMRTDYSNFYFIAISSDRTMYISSGDILKSHIQFRCGDSPDLNISSNKITFLPREPIC